MTEALLVAEKLTKTYQMPDHNARLVLDRIDFTLREGEIVALLGKSGSGKSTFLRLLAGLVPPSGGGVRYRGAPVADRLGVAAGGWDGRLALACVLLLAEALPAAFYALAAIIAVVFVSAAIRDWTRARMPVTFHDDKEDEEA
jgi:ABC-type oligopeptide transport system ATPase subunit